MRYPLVKLPRPNKIVWFTGILSIFLQGCFPASYDAELIERLPFSPTYISIPARQYYPLSIQHFQIHENLVYFSSRYHPKTIFKFDLNNPIVSKFWSIPENNSLDISWETAAYDIDLINERIYVLESHKTQIQLFNLTDFIKSINLPVHDFNCQVRTTFAELPHVEMNGWRFYPAGCYLSPSDPSFYDLAKNLLCIRLSNDEVVESHARIYYPHTYRQGLPINTLITNVSREYQGNLYTSFAAYGEVLVHSLPELKQTQKIQMQSSLFDVFQPMPPALADDGLEEMIHHYSQGYYANLLVWEKGEKLLRIASKAGPLFTESTQLTSQGERIRLMGESIQTSIILFDLSTRLKIGEYLIDGSFINPEVAFIYADRLYLYSPSESESGENELNFLMIDLPALLQDKILE